MFTKLLKSRLDDENLQASVDIKTQQLPILINSQQLPLCRLKWTKLTRFDVTQW